MDYNGFIDKDKDGSYSGYAVDYLDEISRYTGYKYEYVYGQWENLMNQLAAGKIDLICSAQYTDERAQVYDYSKYPIGYTQGILYTLKSNKKLCYEDFEAFDGATVGILSGSAMKELFINYSVQNNFSCKLRDYNTEEELLKALKDGKIDAMCSEHLANHSSLTLLANFGADAYYIISYNNSPYIDSINFALQEIKTDVDFEGELFHKYYDTGVASSSAQFTREESDFINKSGTINVGLVSDHSPLSYEDEDGNADGMYVELMNLVAQKSGLKFKYHLLEPGQTGYDYLANENGDIVAGVASSEFSIINPQLMQSRTFLDSEIVFVGRNGTDFRIDSELTVAVPAGFINGEKVIKSRYPNFSCYSAETNEDCLKAIRDGRADVMLQNLYVIRECLQSPRYDGLEIFPAYSFPEEEKIVSLPENKLLMAIINKSIAAITDEESNDVVINNTIAKSYHANIVDVLYKYRWPLIGIVLLLAIIIAMFVRFSVIRQKSFFAIEKVNNKLEDTNKQLEEAVIQADRASVAKSQFLSRMSHEIRTPMNAIVGLTEVAKQNEGDITKVDDCLGKIAISSNVLLNIINDVLDMSAIETGKLKISNEEFDIKEVFGGISSIYYPQCQNKGIKFRMVTDVKNELLLGDSLRVNQILLNLVSNAYKFTEKGGEINIGVKETAQKDGKAFLNFTVSDTGSGMTEDMKERLFKPFEQEGASTAKKYGGSGLGLSITKNLVDMMHGAITVESEKGKGTTFSVNLPFEIVSRDMRESDESVKSLRVLIVDDDSLAREHASIVMERIGVPFEIAGSGAKALNMIDDAVKNGQAFNVAIIDWRMSDMSGMELTKRIRQNEKNSSLVIIVAAFDISEVHKDALDAGADHFVTKPLFQSTLYDVLMSLTDGELGKSKGVPEKYDFTGHRVLLAEDQELNAEIAIELLGLVNMSADHANDGKKAVEMFKCAQPGTYDAILMDVQMPEMDGYEATGLIRELDRPDAKTIPIYAMTANAFTEDISAALSSGMNGHIAKPIDTKILYQILKDIIDNKGK